MAPLSPGLRATPPTASLSPLKTTMQSLGALSPGKLSPAMGKKGPGSRPSSPNRTPSPSIMASPKHWQKCSISRLAEEFFWIGGSIVAQPKWRLGQIVERCMCTMQAGTQMTKLKGKKRGLVRYFYLDEHKSCIRWRPSRKHDKAKIKIDSIHEVCEGKGSEIFQRYADSRFDPNCCFSIYHGAHVESLDLVSANGEEARTWVTGLKYLLAGISDEDCLARRQRTRDQWLQQTFSEADKNGDGALSIGEVLQLLHKLNVNLPRQKVREMFKEADTDENQGSLAFEEFCAFYKMISTRRDLYLLMISYSNHKEYMDLNDLSRFLEVEQKMCNLTREHLVEIVAQFEPCQENLQRMVLGIDGFTNYMRSPSGDIFNPEHHHVHQDMTQPLCNYFIASSHNTYLTGDQLLSQSRVDMYAYVLQAGCRCVEVDCWDGPDGEPIVHHGYTLTSKILFKDVIETINKYAFAKTPYPVILSIENHCTVPQQKKMAEYLMEVLQDKVDLSTVNMNESKRQPSPEILKGKILVKGKKLPANIDADASEGDVSDEDSADEEEDEEDDTPENADVNGTIDPNQTRKKKRLGRSIMGSFRRKRKKKMKVKKRLVPDGELDPELNSQEHRQIVYHTKKRKTMRLSRALSDLVKYTKSVRVHDIETQAYMTSWQVSSLNESIMNQILQLKPGQLVRFNQRQLLRVYPSNYRVDSSNFNPQPYWNAGCHMVALNYQTEGRSLELNRAKFSSNGNCGYILQPKCMCKGAFNPLLEDPLPGQRKIQLILKIISGQQLPKPKDSIMGDRGEIIDPFVEVEIVGLPVDCAKQQTRVVDDNGFNPMWEETLVFTVQMPQIALVRFEVWDQESIGRDFIGQRTIAFTSMMPGYRHVYLEGMTEASIFVHVALNDIPVKVKSGNAMKGLIKKAAGHHVKGHKKQALLEVSTHSFDDGRVLRYCTDLDNFSQNSSRDSSMSPRGLGPAAKASLHKGAMSEPMTRVHRVQLQEPPGKKKGILTRMSSTVSNSGVATPCVRGASPDLETSSQSSDFESPGPVGSAQPFQPDWPAMESQQKWVEQESPLQRSENRGPEPITPAEITDEQKPDSELVPPHVLTRQLEQTESLRLALLKFQYPPQAQNVAQTHNLPQLPPQVHSQNKYLPDSPYQPQFQYPRQLEQLPQPLVAPSSPARMRRTLDSPASQQPCSFLRTKPRSRSCPRRQPNSPQTPTVNRRHAVHWENPPAPDYDSYCNQVKPIPNGLCMTDSESSSNGSLESVEFPASGMLAGSDMGVGTLQREMNALFNQKMTEIRCKSPIFFNGEFCNFV
ncbi:1-phosphatidylinositol 4,5-bisphosphate phosphodiesterase eta-2 [Aplochiton taeniatus]